MSIITRPTHALVLLFALFVSGPSGLSALGYTPEGLFGASPAALLAAGAEAKGSFKPGDLDGAGVVVLYDDSSYDFDERGAYVYTRRSAYLVLNRSGAESWGEVAAWWEPWHQEKPRLSARVVAPDASVSSPPASTYADQGAGNRGDAVYSDSRRLAVPLPNLRPGAVVEYEIVLVDRDPVLPRTDSFRNWFGTDAPLALKRLTLTCPEALSLRSVYRGKTPPVAVETSSEGRRRLTFTAEDLPSWGKIEKNLPPDPVGLRYLEFSLGDSWKAVAEAYGKASEPYILVDEASAWADEVLGSPKADRLGPADIERLLVRLRKDIRYTGVNFGENSIIPHRPQETLDRGYGDCKDQATLLVAALRGRGERAYLALLNAGSDFDPRPETPGLGLFDHAIVYLPDRDLWLDPTSTYSPGLSLPGADQARLALVIAPETDGLVPTADTGSAGAVLVEERDITFARRGGATLVETTKPQGGFASYYKGNFAGQAEADIKERLERYVRSVYAAASLDGVEVRNAASHDEAFELVVRASGLKNATTDEAYATAYLRVGGLVGFLPDELLDKEEDKAESVRADDLFMHMPCVVEYRYHLVPPPGYLAQALPKGRVRSLGPATLTSSFALDKDGSVRATYRFDAVKRRYSPAEVTATRLAIRAFYDSDADAVSFRNRGEALLEEGDYRGALALFGDLARDHPDDPDPLVRRAKALLAAGLPGAAAEEARAALAVAPDAADAHAALAEALLYDGFGRYLAPGCDLKASAAEYAEAARLDPANYHYRFSQAVLAEYSPRKERYGDGGDFETAIGLYRGMKKDLSESEANNLALLLFNRGRFAEVLDELGSATKDAPRKGLRVAAVAATSGIDAGLREAEVLEPRNEERREVLAKAGSYLFAHRLYPEAAALLSASAGRQGSTAKGAASREFADLVARISRIKACPKPGALEGLSWTYLADLLDPGLALEELRGLYTPDQAAFLSRPEAWSTLEKPSRAQRSGYLTMGFTPDHILDFFGSLGEAAVLTRGPAGVVSWAIPEDSGFPKLTVFAERTGDAWGVVAASGSLADLCRHLRSLLDAGHRAEVLSWFALFRDLDGTNPGLPDLSTFDLLCFDNPGAASDEELAWRLDTMLAASACDLDVSGAVARLLAARAVAPPKSAVLGFEATQDLVKALSRAGRAKDALDVIAGSDDIDFRNQGFAALYALILDQAGRSEEAETFLGQRLAEAGRDTLGWRRIQAERLAGLGRYPEALILFREILASGKAVPGDYNSLAWFSLYAGGLDSGTINRYSLVKRLGGGDSAGLHTLVCLLLDSGRLNEAKDYYARYLKTQGEADADPALVLAYARFAEALGLSDLARRTYASCLDYGQAYRGGSVGAYAALRLQALSGAR